MDFCAAFALIAEQKIREAINNGEFDNLPGAGKPLELEDLSHLPPESRMAYTILKNSDYIDPDPASKQPSLAQELRRTSPEEGKAGGCMRRLGVMMRRVRRAQGQADDAIPPVLDSPYLKKLLKRV